MKWKRLIVILLLLLPLSWQHSTSVNSQTKFFNMSYVFFGTPSSYVNQVDKTKGSLNVVSPNYFDITKEGNLDITWRLQSSFINEMHNRGIKVVPFLANHWDNTAGVNGLQNRDKLARDIAAAIEKYNLDGVNVDIEGVGHAYRDAHTDLIRLLRQYIPNHKEVSVAVAANPNGWKTGWHGFYDYPALGKYADYLMIMAYDESWESPDSPIGPVSSLNFFERSIQYAINQGVPKDRIVAGLPFYGRMWKLDGPTLEGKSITGMGLSSTRVQPLVDQFNGKVQFDEKTRSSYASFTIPKGKNAFVGSTNLTEGNYVIWYDNEPAIREKLSLPAKYGIKGTGSWALYHETPDTWNYYLAALNGSVSAPNEQPINTPDPAPNNIQDDPEPNVITAENVDTGTIGKTTTSVNLRSKASLNGKLVRTLTKNTILKINGGSVNADNHRWLPVALLDGTTGYISETYVKRFNLKELHGETRYETSALVSKSGWKKNSNIVVLGRGDIPIDALTGSVLASKYNAPLLLTKSTALPDSVEKEINRLKPKRIYILGGESAISKSVQNKLKNKGYTVSRIGGSNRYATSVNVASQVGIKNIILTTGREGPDALSVAPYAGLSQTPILLTQPNALPSEIKNVINQKNISKVTIIGGQDAISKNIERELKKLGVQSVVRISGSDRYETSVAIAKYYKNQLDLSNLYFASGVSFIDALPGSPLAAANNSPIILVNNGTMPATVKDLLSNISETPDVNFLGGYSVITGNTRINVFKALK